MSNPHPKGLSLKKVIADIIKKKKADHPKIRRIKGWATMNKYDQIIGVDTVKPEYQLNVLLSVWVNLRGQDVIVLRKFVPVTILVPVKTPKKKAK